MSNLILTEWYKLRLNKTFRTMLTLSITAGLIFTLLLWLDAQNIVALESALGFINLDPSFTGSGLDVFKMVIVDDSMFLTVISAILAGFFISNEYVFGVIKNEVMGGQNRSRIYAAKLVILASGTLLITFIFLAISTIGATFISGFGQVENGSTIIYMIRSLILYILQSLSFHAIIMIFAMLLQESGKTIISSFGFIIMVNLAILALGKINPELTEAVFSYTVFTQLAVAVQDTVTFGEIIKSILVAIFNFIVFFYVGMKAFQRKEIK